MLADSLSLFTKNLKKADFTVAIDNSSEKAMRTAKVFQNPKNTHPLSVKKVLEHINSKLSHEDIVLMANGEPKAFTTNDWKLFLNFYNFKSKREYSYKHEVGNNS